MGKTSLVRHAVDSVFDGSNHSTIGVKIDRKVVTIGEDEVTMILWDVAGEEEFFQIPDSYIDGASGCLFVADGTRPESLRTLKAIRERVAKQCGDDMPSVIMLNKSDLSEEWKISEDERATLAADGTPCLLTSAKLGHGVEAGMTELAAQMLAGVKGSPEIR